jgi:hypothetical protein
MNHWTATCSGCGKVHEWEAPEGQYPLGSNCYCGGLVAGYGSACPCEKFDLAIPRSEVVKLLCQYTWGQHHEEFLEAADEWLKGKGY